MKKYIKEKFLAFGGSFSGVLSFLGSYQICHNLCMILITILAGIGIVLKGMPLLFLQKVATPFWTVAVLILFILIFLKLKNKVCVSNNNLFFNSGLIIVGFPFRLFGNYLIYFWVIGVVITLLSIIIFVRSKFRGNKK